MHTFILFLAAVAIASGGGAYLGAKYGAKVEASVKADLAEIKTYLSKIKL